MRLPSEGLPQELRNKDDVLDGFLSILDSVSETAYKELLKGIDWNTVESVPDSALDFLLFEWGLAIFDGYTPTQKRSLLSNILEIDSKRYTQDGLALFIDAILPTMFADVEVPILLNQISFRNPTIGFPNADMRVTAGRREGDINPYIFNEFAVENRSLQIFLFADSNTEFTNNPDLFTFLEQVIPTELPDMGSQILFDLNKYQRGVEEVSVSGTTVTGNASTTFTTDFVSGEYIGLYSSTLDRVLAFKIASVVTDDQIELVVYADTNDIDQDPATVTFYMPV